MKIIEYLKNGAATCGHVARVGPSFSSWPIQCLLQASQDSQTLQALKFLVFSVGVGGVAQNRRASSPSFRPSYRYRRIGKTVYELGRRSVNLFVVYRVVLIESVCPSHDSSVFIYEIILSI